MKQAFNLNHFGAPTIYMLGNLFDSVKNDRSNVSTCDMPSTKKGGWK